MHYLLRPHKINNGPHGGCLWLDLHKLDNPEEFAQPGDCQMRLLVQHPVDRSRHLV